MGQLLVELVGQLVGRELPGGSWKRSGARGASPCVPGVVRGRAAYCRSFAMPFRGPFAGRVLVLVPARLGRSLAAVLCGGFFRVVLVLGGERVRDIPL